MAILSFSILHFNDPCKTKKGLQYCKPDCIIINPAHTASTANLLQMMKMQMVQEKFHTLFFYKTNKYLLEKKFGELSSFWPAYAAQMSAGQTIRLLFRNPDTSFRGPAGCFFMKMVYIWAFYWNI
jgi:hypothetical protein